MRIKVRERAQRPTIFFIAGVCGLLLGAGLDQIFLRHVGHDQSWCVYAANLMLHGVPLDGPQLVEVNPPFILWFSILPVLLGDLLHIGMLNGFRVFFDCVEVSSLLWTAWLFQRLFHPGRRAFWLFNLAFIFATLWLIGKDSLGQREHLLVLLLLPYLVLTAARLAGEGGPGIAVVSAVLAGVAGGLAICLKPQHLLAVIAVEVLVISLRRSLRPLWQPEMLAFAITVLLYVLSVYAFGRAYLENVTPKLVLTYSALNVPYPVVLRSAKPVAIGLLLGWGLLLMFRARLRYLPLAQVLGVASLGSLAAYILQHKAWSYQEIPAGMLAVLFLAVTLISLAEAFLPAEMPAWQTEQRWPILLAVLGCTLLSASLDLRFGRRLGYFPLKKQELAEIYAAYPRGVAVSYYATEPWEMPLVIEQQKVLGQRGNYLWMLPAIVQGQDPAGEPLGKQFTRAELDELAQYQRSTMAEDLNRWQPAVVVVDECGPNLCPALQREHYGTVLGWLLKDVDFNRQWQHYTPAGRRGDLDIFRRIF